MINPFKIAGLRYTKLTAEMLFQYTHYPICDNFSHISGKNWDETSCDKIACLNICSDSVASTGI